MMLNARIALVTTVWCGIVAATGCNREAGQVGSNADSSSKSQATAAASSQQNDSHRNACDLLTVEEVSAVVGVPVTAEETSDADGTDQPATETNRVAGRSAGWWEGPAGPPRLVVRAYWVDGKKWWEINTAARGMAKTMIQKQEGVALESVLKTGPVSGLGDKAIFSPGLGSLVLKGDVLLDIMQPYWPKPEAQFLPLVTKMLSRL